MLIIIIVANKLIMGKKFIICLIADTYFIFQTKADKVKIREFVNTLLMKVVDLIVENIERNTIRDIIFKKSGMRVLFNLK